MCISKIVSTDLNECSFLRSIEARSEIVDGTFIFIHGSSNVFYPTCAMRGEVLIDMNQL